MCTRFVFNGNDTITGFNFDIDLSVWKHKLLKENNYFYIGIFRPDGVYHSYHGINRNGNVGTLLYVHGNPNGAYKNTPNSMTIAELTEQFIKGQISFDDALKIVKTMDIVYAPDATMQSMLSDIQGRVLIIEPGIGFREEHNRYSLMTNYSLLSPESTTQFIVPGDDRYERALRFLSECENDFSITNAFKLLRSVHQEGIWATRISFIYSVKEKTIYYVENNRFTEVKRFVFPELEHEISVPKKKKQHSLHER